MRVDFSMAEMASCSFDYVLLLIGLSLLYFPRQRLCWGGEPPLTSERQSKNADKNDFDPSVRRLIGLLAKQQLVFLNRSFLGL
jgi:hypothetical protein